MYFSYFSYFTYIYIKSLLLLLQYPLNDVDACFFSEQSVVFFVTSLLRLFVKFFTNAYFVHIIMDFVVL